MGKDAQPGSIQSSAFARPVAIACALSVIDILAEHAPISLTMRTAQAVGAASPERATNISGSPFPVLVLAHLSQAEI